MPKDDGEQLVLQVHPLLFQRLGTGIRRGINLALDTDNVAVDLVVLVEKPAEMGVAQLEGVDGVAMLREFDDQGMM